MKKFKIKELDGRPVVEIDLLQVITDGAFWKSEADRCHKEMAEQEERIESLEGVSNRLLEQVMDYEWEAMQRKAIRRRNRRKWGCRS